MRRGRQHGDDVFSYTGTQIVLRWVTTEVGEGQNRDDRCGAQGCNVFYTRTSNLVQKLQVARRDSAQSANSATVHRLRERFHLPAKDIQAAAKRGLKLDRGFPAAIQLDALQGW